MFERLTRIDAGGIITGAKRSKGEYVCTQEMLERLYEYENSGLSPEEVQELAKAKAEGRLVVLPCKPGDTIYMPFCGRAIDYIIDRWEIRQDDTYAISRGGGRLCKADAIGKTVFLSPEEAEKAIGGGKDE